MRPSDSAAVVWLTLLCLALSIPVLFVIVVAIIMVIGAFTQ